MSVKKNKSKPYPRKCSDCGKVSVFESNIPYNAEIVLNGMLYSFLIPELAIDQCNSCGEQFFTVSTDEHIEVAFLKYASEEMQKFLDNNSKSEVSNDNI